MHAGSLVDLRRRNNCYGAGNRHHVVMWQAPFTGVEFGFVSFFSIRYYWRKL